MMRPAMDTSRWGASSENGFLDFVSVAGNGILGGRIWIDTTATHLVEAAAAYYFLFTQFK